MKLLFDQNLSHRLAHARYDPDSLHVRVGLKKADDAVVWDYAKRYGFVIVSKDIDFHQRSFVFGAPPKVIGIRLGNCSTADVEQLLRQHVQTVEAFGVDTELAFLSLSR